MTLTIEAIVEFILILSLNKCTAGAFPPSKLFQRASKYQLKYTLRGGTKFQELQTVPTPTPTLSPGAQVQKAQRQTGTHPTTFTSNSGLFLLFSLLEHSPL